MKFITGLAFAMMGLFCSCAQPLKTQETKSSGWPAITQESKPWTRWWWHGSALTKEGVTAEMEAYQKAGIGGLEITPIYGVYGRETEFINYLSPEWMELLKHVFKEAARLDMGIDMATGTGWPFGGPWVTNEDACKSLRYKIYEVKGGSQLQEKIEFIQPPYLRLVGNQIYEVTESAEAEGRKLMGSRKEPALVMDTKSVKITDLVDPVNENKNLQALAIDQVQFEKPLKLKLLMAYGDNHEVLDVTSKVTTDGKLHWTAPAGDWKLYAVFEGYHGKMVERAGPGGEGNVIDHFSDIALKNYLQRFDDAFKGSDISPLRSFFNDSYEVDDARGTADFTPALFEAFLTRRGYDLRLELPALFGKDDVEKNKRVLCDYRETIGELLLDNFTQQWKSWANKHQAMVRNQAHGSPANILDLYGVVDIPEIEGTEPLRFKMASSSGNVSGKRLIAAEAATWLNEHFESNLADIKGALDKFMLHGVNHLVYHGTCYSSASEPWPGRLFYAAVHLNPRNPLWNDVDALNAYVARCQSFLQQASPDNDVLLYYPVYDRFSAPGPELIEHFDGIGKSFAGTSFALCAEQMLQKGYSFDYISDKQIQHIKIEKEQLITSGGTSYKTMVIPKCEYMPLATLEKLLALAQAGARIILVDQGPGSVSGFKNGEQNKKRFNEVHEKLLALNTGNAGVRTGSDVNQLLLDHGIQRETMFDAGIHGIRKKNTDGSLMYFINNTNAKAFEGWLTIRANAETVGIYDPMTGKSGKARIRKSNSGTEVFVKLEATESVILQEQPGVSTGIDFPYPQIAGEPIPLSGKWKLSFDDGGPVLPPSLETDSLAYWTSLKDESYKNFSGTATYALTFDKPKENVKQWLIRFESIKESADVFLNGTAIGTLIGPVYQLNFSSSLLKGSNLLQIKVSNLMANRIAYLDRNNIFWKKFYNVNFPARKRENVKNNLFDASQWQTRPSGIAGTVEIYPLKEF